MVTYAPRKAGANAKIMHPNNSAKYSIRAAYSPLKALRVLLTANHPLWLVGLRHALQTSAETGDQPFQIVGEATEGQQTLQLAQKLQPDLIVMELELSDGSGLEIAKTLRKLVPHIMIVGLSSYEDETHRKKAMEAGTQAYLPKTINTETLLEMIKHLTRGNSSFNQVLDSTPPAGATALTTPNPISAQFTTVPTDIMTAGGMAGWALSTREVEILNYLAQGKTNSEIACQLGISDQTVKNHVTNINRKLRTRGRTEAVIIGLKRGWIQLPSWPKDRER